MGLTSDDDSLDEFDLSDYAQSSIQQVLARVPGVGEVETFGSQYAMRVWLNPDKLTDYRMTVDEVVRSLQAYNVEVSAGQFGGAPAVEGQRLNASVIVQTLLKTPEEFAAIPLRTNPDGSVVRVRDVGRTELGTERYGTRTLYNGHPAAGLAVRQAPGANALDTADAVKAKMKELSRYFPHGMRVIYPYDTTPFVRVAIKEVVDDPLRSDTARLSRHVCLSGKYPGHADPHPGRAGGDPGDLRRPGDFRVLHQHADHVRDGVGHRPPGG